MNPNESYFNLSGASSTTLPTSLTRQSSRLCEIHPTTKNLATALLLIAICTVTVCGNLAVCLTVCANRILNTTTYLLIFSLAVADLLVSLLSMPFRIHFLLHNKQWCLGENACALWVWVDLVSCSASIGSLAAVSIERFIAVKYPLRYQALMTQRTALVMIVIVWCYSAFWAFLGHYNWSDRQVETYETVYFICGKKDRLYYTIVAALAFFLPLGIIIGTYSYITRVAFRQRRRNLRNVVRPAESTQAIKTIRVLQELKAAKMMACVVGVFCVCWLPFFILLYVSLWRGLKRNPAIGEIFRTILPNLNSSVNPFIYMLFTRDLRLLVGKMLLKTLPVLRVCRSNAQNSVK
ncbi:histamine H2 receptor-like [Montipora capricornis]|uniref:histamine H2 receptor-like n=1 Tax=Montipora capricornis TaxID=246305 RepID=UPI0035F111B4